jgi:hypothetical protein
MKEGQIEIPISGTIVYVCEFSVEDIGSQVKAVFDSKEKAKDWCLTEAKKLKARNNYYGNFDIEDLPRGKKVEDITFTFEEWEVM